MKRSTVLTIVVVMTAVALATLAGWAAGRAPDLGVPAARDLGARALQPNSTIAAQTDPAITESDLRRRLYIFADDSMQGRAAGSPGHERATAYLARELARLGLVPAGDSGSYFQRVPLSGPSPDTVWSRNVVAVLPGRDPALRSQYVAVGAHSDHIGMRPEGPVDHDSLRARSRAVWVRRGRAAGTPELSSRQERALDAAVAQDLAALRSVRPTRLDSIYNGADDDGSGSMALLELAEVMATSDSGPRRSMLFVWHTGEEIALDGSRELTARPPVPLAAIVAQINIDMIGRGSAVDLAAGGPGYLGVIGPRRRSTELARWVTEVNAALPAPLSLDSALDADGHPEAIYCRSDHWMYARRGIPIVFLFTNLHEDYHQVTDEAQYIDYPHFLRITHFVHALLRRIADNDSPPRTDRAAPKPNAACTQ